MIKLDVKEAILKRRAYRSLDPVEITEDLIHDLAECAQLAPSCMNKQPWNLVFIKEKTQLDKIFTTLSKGNKWVEKASLIIVVFGKMEEDCHMGERLYYLFDLGLASSQIILRATELGLVAHPIAGFNPDQVKEILKIPEDSLVITLINIRKHSDEINPELSENMKLGEKQRPPRKDLDEFTFIDYYKPE